MQEKFIDTIELDEWEVETDTGWSDIKAIGKTVEFEEFEILTENGLNIICADTHIVFDMDMNEIYAKDLIIGSSIVTKSGIDKIKSVKSLNQHSHMYDLQLEDENHRFYTNGILSHNSIWLANLSLNMAISGTNVLLVSLEMKAEKIFKRMGSNAFNIPMDQYKDHAANTERMVEIMRKYKEDHEGFEPVGELRAKKFTSATVDDIRAFKRMEEDRLGIKFGAIVLDYFTELENSHGTDYANMYIYHKQNSNDLFNFAGEDDIAVVSAHQLAGVAFGADDLFLTNLGESKGIIHRVDNIIGIIQPPGMKLDNKYVLKNLKPRDGGYKNHRIHYDIDYSFMRIKETEIHEKPGEMVVGKID